MGFLRGVIKLVGVVMTLVTSALLLAFGISLFWYTKFEVTQIAYDAVDEAWKNLISYLPEGYSYRAVPATVIALLGFFVLISLFLRGKRNKRRSISYMGAHGEVTIELEHVEGTLENVAKKLPDVKDIAIRLEPSDSRNRVIVHAQAYLFKDPEVEAKQLSDRVQEYLLFHTRKIIGVQEVEVNLKVKKTFLNMKSIKPMPLLLAGPENAAAVAKVMNDDGAVAQSGEEGASQAS